MTDDPRFYQLQTQVNALRETVERQGRTIDALIASLPQLSQQAPGAPTGGRSGSGGKVYREWVSWLGQHGPAFRQDVMDAVGKPLPGNQPVLDWTSVMATWPDDAVPDDTLCKINGISTGQGRPPTVYFLWRHRFDVYGGFGVGPSERPEVETTKAETMLGVVHPPTNPVTFGTPWDEPMATVEESQSIESEPTEETTLRYATMEEWYARWNPLFDILAAHDDKPSEGEKEEMLATLPEDTGGEPANTILARSFYEAKVRSRS